MKNPLKSVFDAWSQRKATQIYTTDELDLYADWVTGYLCKHKGDVPPIKWVDKVVPFDVFRYGKFFTVCPGNQKLKLGSAIDSKNYIIMPDANPEFLFDGSSCRVFTQVYDLRDFSNGPFQTMNSVSICKKTASRLNEPNRLKQLMDHGIAEQVDEILTVLMQQYKQLEECREDLRSLRDALDELGSGRQQDVVGVINKKIKALTTQGEELQKQPLSTLIEKHRKQNAGEGKKYHFLQGLNSYDDQSKPAAPTV